MASKSDTFTSGESSTQDFINSQQLTDLTWAHAVNNKDYLEEVLNGKYALSAVIEMHSRNFTYYSNTFFFLFSFREY